MNTARFLKTLVIIMSVGFFATFANAAPPGVSLPALHETVTELENAVDELSVVVNTKQTRVTGDCPPGQAIQAINEDGSVSCETTRDQHGVTVFPLSTLQDFSIPINVEPTFLRELGTFEKQLDDSRILILYNDVLRVQAEQAPYTACAVMVKIDDPRLDSDNCVGGQVHVCPPIIMTMDTVNGMLSASGVYSSLDSGTHTVSLYYRNVFGTCDRNAGNWPGHVTVIEMP